MLKALIALALVSMLAALLWYAKDYGSTGAELEHATDQIEIIETADIERQEIEASDATNVMQAIDNTSYRAHINQQLKQQAADHERELEKARNDVDTLSGVTVERMQQFASKNSPRQQLATR